MSFDPRPCPHCGGTSFTVIPNLGFDVYVAPSVHGGPGEAQKIKLKVPRLYASVVGCQQCGRIEMFSGSLAQLAAMFPTATTATSTRTG